MTLAAGSHNLTFRYFGNTEDARNTTKVTGYLHRQATWLNAKSVDQVRNKKGTTIGGNLIAELGDHTVWSARIIYHLYGDFLYYRIDFAGVSFNVFP